MKSTNLHLFADIGGTFSDCLFWEPPAQNKSGRGKFSVKKLLSTGVIPIQVRKTSNPQRLILENYTWKTHHSLQGYSLDIPGQINGSAHFKIVATDDNPDCLILNQPIPETIPSHFTAKAHFGQSPVITAIRAYLGLKPHETLPPVNIRYATTTGTNALLERSGSTTALMTTRGFEDILSIGYQDRPDLFKLNIKKPDPLAKITVGVTERMNAYGQIETPLDKDSTLMHLLNLKSYHIDSIAISLLNSWVNPDHELQVAQLAHDAGFANIYLSHQSSPLIKLIPRTDTTIADAYLTPVMTRHFDDILHLLHPESTVKIMTSAGGLTNHSNFTGKHSVLSGPAGGIVALEKVHSLTHYSGVIGFDMGGTSTDISRYDGSFEYRFETRIAGTRLTTPRLNIETVAAGGGSVCHFQGARLRVGPHSAGANPGPAAYGNGGPLTLTDVNAYLGYIPRFPFPLDTQAIETRLRQTQAEIRTHAGHELPLHQLAVGYRKIACETMAASIRKISLARGYDIRSHALCCFGGAGPQHACEISELLGINTVVIHPLASVLSAYGLSVAPVKVILEKPIMEIYREKYLYIWKDTFAELHASAREMVQEQGVSADRCSIRKMVDVRYMGQSHTLTIDIDHLENLEDNFHDAHQQFYGHTFQGRGIEITALRLELTGMIPAPELPLFPISDQPAEATGSQEIFIDNSLQMVPIFTRDTLKPGQSISGPALIAGPDTSIVVAPAWNATVNRHLMILLAYAPQETHHNQPADLTRTDPIFQEVIHHRLASIAEEMGLVLQKSAVSTNIKDRLDFSCAVFSADGFLTANAPHIPVHLGAMGETVRAIKNQFGKFIPGDVIVTNDPYQGGSHLPDVTIVMPVFGSDDNVCYFTAVRAHHAEIGGISPGSMPPDARNLQEEGVVIPPINLNSKGHLNLDRLRHLLTSAKHPSRAPEDNISDILAQIAACRRGAKLLVKLTEDHSFHVVNHYMSSIRKTSASAMKQALDQLPRGKYLFTDYLDDGSPISVTISLSDLGAEIDFHGTGPVLTNNLNANPAIVRSAVMYCFRCMINSDIPLNEGVLDPVTIKIPTSLLNPPFHPDPAHRAAVAGGNVETSQRICDVIFGALGIVAAGQGTMNNVTIGNDSFSYYETIGGGSGAGRDFPGAHGVQVNMTNTRITDPEVIERNFGIEVTEFSIRGNSGGVGQQTGGNGLIRQYRFKEPLEVTILSERRGEFPPFGLDNARSGAIGVNTLIDIDGNTTLLPGKVTARFEAGQQLRIETPGGGGYGKKS